MYKNKPEYLLSYTMQSNFEVQYSICTALLYLFTTLYITKLRKNLSS